MTKAHPDATPLLTVLDNAWQAAIAVPDGDPAWLRFYARLADGELFVLLEREASATRIEPRVFALEDGPMVVAFDTAERLAAFTGMPAPYAALPGRALIDMLAQADPPLSLGLNLGVAPSSRHLPPELLAWLATALAQRPQEVFDKIAEFLPPADIAEPLLAEIDARLARAGGLAAGAWLVAARFDGDALGHLLVVIDPALGVEPMLARALGEALTFSDHRPGRLDVAFLGADDPVLARIARVGLRFDLPQPESAAVSGPPGADPERPPRLR